MVNLKFTLEYSIGVVLPVYERYPFLGSCNVVRAKGARLPTPQPLIADPTTRWTRLPVVWYNHPLPDIELSTHQAIWSHAGQASVPIRFILSRDCSGKFDPQARLDTAGFVDTPPTTVVSH
ncbi:MAG: hypothetical protein ACYDBJ_09060 [Aggregatilineales bacterium]